MTEFSFFEGVILVDLTLASVHLDSMRAARGVGPGAMHRVAPRTVRGGPYPN
jgi:hypothetical protein